MLEYMCLGVGMVHYACGGQRATHGSQFSFHTMYGVLGVKFRLSGSLQELLPAEPS